MDHNPQTTEAYVAMVRRAFNEEDSQEYLTAAIIADVASQHGEDIDTMVSTFASKGAPPLRAATEYDPMAVPTANASVTAKVSVTLNRGSSFDIYEWTYDEARAILSALTMQLASPMLRDVRPHSRACGLRLHDHGTDCNSNCPTCHGR